MKLEIKNPKQLSAEITFVNGMLFGLKIESPDFNELTKLLADINNKLVEDKDEK